MRFIAYIWLCLSSLAYGFRRRMSAVCLIAATLTAHAAVDDLDRAIRYCDTHALAAVEGVWSFPEDKVTVMIAESEQGKYSVTVIDSECVDVVPGMQIAEMERTGEKGKYKLTFFGRGNIIKHRQSFMARLSDTKEVIALYKKKFNWRVNVLGLFPYIGRVLRVGYGGGSDYSTVPGMFKVYPSYDGNGSSREKARVL